jgi:dynein heavy chain 1
MSKPIEWKAVLAEVKNASFINNVTNFNKDDIPAKCKQYIRTQYLNDPKFDLGKIERSSKAALPLAMWVKSIVEYSEIFHQIEPLRQELSTLTQEGEQMKEEKNRLDEEVTKLENSIKQLS